MNEVYLAGCGLASGLGADLATALAALASDRRAPERYELPGGSAWPLLTIPAPSVGAPLDDLSDRPGAADPTGNV